MVCTVPMRKNILLPTSKRGARKMNVELITRDDLERFKSELFEQLKTIVIKPNSGEQKWLKSYQVKNLLKISNNTLQTLRNNGTIPFTKIGGIHYYNYEDIMKVLKGEVKSKRISISK